MQIALPMFFLVNFTMMHLEVYVVQVLPKVRTEALCAILMMENATSFTPNPNDPCVSSFGKESPQLPF